MIQKNFGTGCNVETVIAIWFTNKSVMKMLKNGTYKKKTTVNGKPRTFTAHQSWQEIDGRKIFFRSDWEYKFAIYLQRLKCKKLIKEWHHEPETFWYNEIKRGVRSYKPDFKVICNDDTHYWVEIKGYMDSKSITKIKRFKKYYPHEKLMVLGKEWFEEGRGVFVHGEESQNIPI